eukprot:4456845-Pyramimonas_sp.AAC.1
MLVCTLVGAGNIPGGVHGGTMAAVPACDGRRPVAPTTAPPSLPQPGGDRSTQPLPAGQAPPHPTGRARGPQAQGHAGALPAFTIHHPGTVYGRTNNNSKHV